jgi:two-component system, NarL family, invasion response regulator UvrY
VPERDVTVLLVDDQEPFRSVARDVVTATRGMALAGEAETGEDALDTLDELTPDIVIMDKRMPGMGGVEAARAILARRPATVVVLVSVEHPTPELVDASGAAVFLPKSRLSPRMLIELWERYGTG